MKKKIIDLLNDIADGKEAPKKIKYKEHNLIYDKEDIHDYIYISLGGEITCDTLLENIDSNNLNDYAEILEDKHEKIEKLGKEYTENACLTDQDKVVTNKLNEVIDKVNYLLEKSDNDG